MEEDECMPHLAMSRAIAIITPNPEVSDNISIIPRVAYLYDSNGNVSREFKVNPEDAPTICNHCDCVGHVAAACPKTVEGLDLLMNSDDEVSMGEGDISTALSYPWGEYSDYVVVEPVTQNQKKAAKKAINKKKQLEKLEKERVEKEESEKRAAENARIQKEQQKLAEDDALDKAIQYAEKVREELRREAEITRQKHEILATENRIRQEKERIFRENNLNFISEISEINFDSDPVDPEDFQNLDNSSVHMMQSDEDDNSSNDIPNHVLPLNNNNNITQTILESHPNTPLDTNSASNYRSKLRSSKLATPNKGGQWA
jgi:hypothetical protein